MKTENYILRAIKIGLLSGAIGIFLCLIGMVEIFDKRDVVEKIITLGLFLLLTTFTLAGYIASSQTSGLGHKNQPSFNLVAGLISGLTAGILISLFTVFGTSVNLRAVFLNATPALFGLLTFEKGLAGIWILPLVSAITGLVGGAFYLLPHKIKYPISRALLVLIFMALFANLFRVVLINQGEAWAVGAKKIFGQTGLTILGAIIFITLTVAGTIWWSSKGTTINSNYQAMPKNKKRILQIIGLALIALIALGLPQVSGPFIALVIVTISLYILMGLGLNITLGFAGLLDLGFVAFYAVGAYTVGLLTSYGPFGLQQIPFWVAVPIAVLVATLFGALLGLPVLGIRGDYLAIATMGFGEIIRLLAGSDFLSPFFGGPQGVIGIQKPCIGTLGPYLTVDVPRICNGIELGKPQDIYYLAVISAIIIAFIAIRLRDSRLGRAWLAIREDEDVAEALGVNLIQTKLLAYMLGAAFAGLGGAIFTVLIGSIFASSMQLIVSINVVALLVVGGMGSIPGVIVGAIALIGLPELLREVSEFRYLIYGLVLIIMMQLKPEGLWPYEGVKRELHHESNVTEN